MDIIEPIKIDPNTFLRQHFTLPALPKLVYQIQEIIQSDNINLLEVSKLMSGDPALVAQILKVVNSAYYSLPKEISDVKFAIAYLGLNEVYRIVLSISVVNTMDIKGEADIKGFWFHSFFSALCAKYVSRKLKSSISNEDLWSAAILHDIGKLVYLRFFPDHYKRLKEFSHEQGCLFSEAEAHFSLPSSAYFGTLLCDHWRLPTNIKESCRSHSLIDLRSTNAEAKPAQELIRILCLANLLAVLSADELNTGKKAELRDVIMASISCSEKDFLVMMADVYELKIEVDKFI